MPVVWFLPQGFTFLQPAVKTETSDHPSESCWSRELTRYLNVKWMRPKAGGYRSTELPTSRHLTKTGAPTSSATVGSNVCKLLSLPNYSLPLPTFERVVVSLVWRQARLE